ncbi:DUF5675 family protein [Hymenobacter sp.]|uniref:DUF5675 family protein n=1 Tax=Hymenobacter sp. TaxID=1898978 RepID=UPI00286BD493|nr:DUF5675 family protein [Hymenobacter sp.]
MHLDLYRDLSAHGCTLSRLHLAGNFECFVCEDVVRTGPKVWGKTAIPAGTYRVVITFSPRFQTYLPLLLNVPGYQGIRIHSGNSEHQSLGCLLPGQALMPGRVGVLRSRAACASLFAKLKKVEKKEVITLTIHPAAA